MGVKKPHIGELRLIGHFENNTGRVAYTAGYVDGYTNIIASVPCKITPKNFRRVDDFGEIQIVSGWQMICRFTSQIDQNKMLNTKFVQGNKRYTIKGISVIDERNFFYLFDLTTKNV
jgi:hypothetical protein